MVIALIIVHIVLLQTWGGQDKEPGTYRKHVTQFVYVAFPRRVSPSQLSVSDAKIKSPKSMGYIRALRYKYT
jgi:hypothetical protein